jgi:hypothetical protein
VLSDLLQAGSSPTLLAKNIADRDDLRFPMTAAEFLAEAWRLANDKARELGWLNDTRGENMWTLHAALPITNGSARPNIWRRLDALR